MSCPIIKFHKTTFKHPAIYDIAPKYEISNPISEVIGAKIRFFFVKILRIGKQK